jgi:putative peptide zinc metalloprotease protein
MARRWGGEVHEIGLMLLVFSPVPYVDASSAWGFRDKRKRMVVGGVGIAVELFLGALALFVWLMVEPGMVRAVAYNVMLISGVSTLLFNGNPLLRFDGYYVLADAIEVPNLGARSNTYLGYLFQRYVLGIRTAESSAHSNGERAWMVVYGITSFFYRIFISFVIITVIVHINGSDVHSIIVVDELKTIVGESNRSEVAIAFISVPIHEGEGGFHQIDVAIIVEISVTSTMVVSGVAV